MLTDVEVRARRSIEKLTQSEFARRWKISRQYLSEIESGKHRIVTKKLEAKWDEAFGKKRIVPRADWEIAVICPYCLSLPRETIFEDKKDLLNNVYRCRECDKTFTGRHAWGD